MAITRTPLTLYRRHKDDCEVHKTNLKPREKRNYMACGCALWIFGSTETSYLPRQSLGTSDLAVGQAKFKTLLRGAQDQVVHGPSITDCTARYLAARKSEVSDHTLGEYRVMLQRLQDYCATRNIQYMRELTIDLLEDFKLDGMGDIADTTKRVTVGKLKTFLKDAHRRGWILLPLHITLLSHFAEHNQKEPYPDAEIERIFDAIENLEPSGTGYRAIPASFRLLLELMLETGLRVSDAIRFDPRILKHDVDSGMWVYSFVQTKRKRKERPRIIDVYIPNALKLAIDRCQWFSSKLPFWRDGWTGYNLGQRIWQIMQAIGKSCNVSDCRPHRLRDTFAVRKLLQGVAIGDVSQLLGHASVQTTEKDYAKWIPARSRRLAKVVAQSLVDAGSGAL
ncbi:MAG: tyrosine-type recombinase/integrase [Acidobacteriia bacterium]|nr:tyrosine-type recombinase/integrase [Terriglobia bacterium]